jgi:hypothetical protein
VQGREDGPLPCDGATVRRCDGVARLAGHGGGSVGSARVGRERNRAVEGTGVARGWLGVTGGVAGDSEKCREQRAESEKGQ